MLKRCALFAVIVLLLGRVGLAADRRMEKSRLVVMTLNAEFMWDGEQPEEGQVQFSRKGAPSEAAEHMQDVATIIIRSNPDIVNLVEIENLAALNKLNNDFLSGRGYRPFFVQGKDTFTGQDVALLTRIDPEGGEIKRDDRKGQAGGVSKSVSKNYYAKFTVGDLKFSLIGIHFLARPNADSRRAAREAQAAAVRRLAVELDQQGYPPIVLGDFNDYDGHVEARDHIDSLPITNVLRNIKAMRRNNSSDDLVNAARFVPKAARFTAFWDKDDDEHVDHPSEHTSIDHILLAPSLAERIAHVSMPHAHDPRAVTDHYPVVVRLTLDDDGGTSGSPVVISRLLPNPPGDERVNEQATLKNASKGDVSLVGWKLRDLAGKTWSLDSLGTLTPGQEKTIKRNGQPMAMNNRRDTIELLNQDGQVVQSVSYRNAREGDEITPDH